MKEKVISIAEFSQNKRKQQDNRILDAQASFVSLEKCLKTIEMNSMPELRNLKAMMRRTMKELRDIGNGRQKSKR